MIIDTLKYLFQNLINVNMRLTEEEENEQDGQMNGQANGRMNNQSNGHTNGHNIQGKCYIDLLTLNYPLLKFLYIE